MAIANANQIEAYNLPQGVITKCTIRRSKQAYVYYDGRGQIKDLVSICQRPKCRWLWQSSFAANSWPIANGH